MKHTGSGPFRQGSRRPTRQQAKAAAAVMASAVFDRDAAGGIVQITDRRALGLLERAFCQLILRGGEPFAIQISPGEAAAFPGHAPIAGGSYALAVGFDQCQRATFSTAGAAAVCGDRSVDAADAARLIAMIGLQRGLQVTGIPARGQA